MPPLLLPEQPIVASLWGKEGLWKTTIALSWPKPIFDFEFDVGSFARASWRLTDAEQTLIHLIKYPQPMQIEKLTGVQKEGITLKFPKKIVGVKEVWQKFVGDFVKAVQLPREQCRTIIFDSSTMLWSIAHRGYLQEKQEVQLAKTPNMNENDFREKLQTIEYGEPNSRMSSLIMTARSYDKNLVLIHYPRDVYGERLNNAGEKVEYKTGKVEPDGFKETRKLVDIEILAELGKDKNNQDTVVCKVGEKCALAYMGTKAMGLSLPESSYQGLVKLQLGMKGD